MPKMRIMTDFCAEQYWTVVSEMEVPSLDEFEQMMSDAAWLARGDEEVRESHEGLSRPRGRRAPGNLQDRVVRPRRTISCAAVSNT